MIKNILITFMIFVMTTTTTMAQVPTFTLKTGLVSIERSEMVTRPRSVNETIKKHFREESFIYKGEEANHQGYILTIKDRKSIKSIFELIESSCGSLIAATGASCNQELDNCQKDCDERVKDIQGRNEQLSKDKLKLEKDLESESNKKIIFSSIAAFVGIGFGALFMSVAK